MNTLFLEQVRNIRTARNSFRRSLRSKKKAKQRRRMGSQFVSGFSISGANADKKWIDLMVPEILCLDTNYDQTVSFVSDIRRYALKERRPVRLVFNQVKQAKVSALLLLLAEVHRCRITRGPHLVTGTYPENEKLERMLCAMGFFEILGVRSRVEVKRTYPMNYIKFASSDRLKEHQSRKLRSDLLGEKIVMEVRARKRLQRAITEAMLNAVQHAYPHGSTKQHPGRNRWWLTGTYNRKTKDLVIMFCDLGVGIPATVTKLYLMENIRAVLSTLPGIQISDGQMIQAAMELGRTRTGSQGRGKGLNDLRKFIDQANAGELKIYSKKGSYTYVPGKNEETENYQRSIGGTLIKWRVPIVSVTDWSGEDDVDLDD